MTYGLDMIKHAPFLLAIVEDEDFLRENLIDFFTLKGMRALGFASAEAFYAVLHEYAFDLVILDVILPGDNGIDAARFVRTQSNVPLLVLTNNNQAHLSSLEAGVDVFLSKSSSLEIIEHSVRNILLRAQISKSAADGDTSASHLNVNHDWALSLHSKVLIAPNQLFCQFTHMEFLLLYTLFNNAQQTVHRVDLLQAIAKTETVSNLRNLDTYVSRIRRKCLNATLLEVPIQSAYNSGYIFTGKAKFLS